MAGWSSFGTQRGDENIVQEQFGRCTRSQQEGIRVVRQHVTPLLGSKSERLAENLKQNYKPLSYPLKAVT